MPPLILWNPTVYRRVYKSPPLVRVLSQINPAPLPPPPTLILEDNNKQEGGETPAVAEIRASCHRSITS
jgi:hypothetical protein